MNKLQTVEILSGLRLRLRWDNGEETIHDLTGLVMQKRWARPLRDPEIFSRARVSMDGHEVSWPDTDIELSASGLWEDIHPSDHVASKWMSPSDMQQWRAEMGLTWNEAADALGISRRTLGNYLSGNQEIPKAVWLACMELAARAHRTMNETGSVWTAQRVYTLLVKDNVVDVRHVSYGEVIGEMPMTCGFFRELTQANA